MNKLVSVIIPTFNRASVILRAVHSVLNQNYKNIELIVIDDGSTDKTKSLLEELAKQNMLIYLKKNNGGVSSARNAGIARACGEWIAFLDSDDEWLSEKIAMQMTYLKAHPETALVYTGEIWMRNGVRVNQKKVHTKSGGMIFEKCLKQCLIAPSSVLLSKKLLLEMNGFDESFVVCEDYDLWLRISLKYEIGYIETPLIIKYGGHLDQLSTQYIAMDMWRLKSMYALYKKGDLNTPTKFLLSQEMKKKGNVLLKGYKKYNNPEALHLVTKMLSDLDL